MSPKKNSFCSFCGGKFPAGNFPKTCGSCGETTWLNPIPVAVVLQPVDDGLLVIRRGIPPQLGELALPGGFINLGETWQQGASRELYEETGIVVNPASLVIFDVVSTERPPLIIFARAPRLRSDELEPFTLNSEVTERMVLTVPAQLAFPSHTEMARRFFAQARS